jgi:hypothetical protein
VFFLLKDRSDTAKARLIAACNEYLTGHPGTIFYACGILEPELDREVNDRDFDVALHLVFESRAAHDAYQAADRHVTFVEQNKATWARVRVFDSLVETA